MSLASVRAALGTLRAHGGQDLAGLTLVSDGVGVYLCRGDDEVVDRVRGGQDVIGLALGWVITEVAAAVTQLPADLVGAEAQRRPRLQVVS